jgi:ketosteroid isomerase-like protein
MKRLMVMALAAVAVWSTVPPALAADRDVATEIKARETAFAKTMADRDLQAFSGFVSEEGVFFGGKGAIRGRDAVVAAWKRFFEGPDAPFSWAPETAEVLKSGKLGLTSGPVHDPKGELIGTFTTIWRLEKDGKWRVVFDKGCDVCKPVAEPEKAPEPKQ